MLIDSTAKYERLAKEPLLSFNPGAILGGTSVEFDAEQSRGTAFGKTNVVAEQTVVSGDLRTISREQREMARMTMMEVAAAHLPHTSSELTFEDSYPPMPPSDAAAGWRCCDQASRDVGAGAVGATDHDPQARRTSPQQTS
jgi:glutamate carboxypeptidase